MARVKRRAHDGRLLGTVQLGWGMLCHQMRASAQSPSKKRAWSTPSSTMRGSGSPGSRAGNPVPVDAAQIRNSSSDAT